NNNNNINNNINNNNNNHNNHDNNNNKSNDGNDLSISLKNQKDIVGHNLLHIACAYNNIDFIKEYQSEFDPNQLDPNGWSPMRIACDRGHVEALHELLKHKNINYNEVYPETRAKTDNQNLGEHKQNDTQQEDAKENQGQEKEDANRSEYHERSFLHEFIARGDTDIVNELLTCPINLEAADAYGRTPLHIAVLHEQEVLLIHLLQKGAFPNLGDYNGNRPLHLAKSIN
ncbi:hypothetical protein RFI_22786, partial [Reticulomyxa filosa]